MRQEPKKVHTTLKIYCTIALSDETVSSLHLGRVAEWLNVPPWKGGIRKFRIEGSNPSPSARIRKAESFGFLPFLLLGSGRARLRRPSLNPPGVTLNLSKSGVSATVGRKGASVSVGKRGTYLNAGQPGTGIYSRTRLDKPAGRRRSAGKTNAEIEAPEQTDPVTESAAAPEAPARAPGGLESAVALLKCIALLAFIGLCLAGIWSLLAD